MSDAPAIALANLSVIYGPRPAAMLEKVHALAAAGATPTDIRAATGHTPGLIDVSLTIPAGSLFVVMGLSGSGKSTLLRTINRLVTPVAGRVTVGGEDVTALGAEGLRAYRRATTAMVFQTFGLLPHRSVVDNVAFPLRIAGRSATEARRSASGWLERLGLGGHAGAGLDELSIGMKQRVGLARALVTGATVLLMDEPFSALDPITRRALQDEVRGLQRDLGKTVVLITHDPLEARRLADRIAVVRAGRIVQTGTPAELVARPADPHVAALFAAAEV